MSTTNPSMTFTAGAAVTSGYLSVNGQVSKVDPANAKFYSFITANSNATGFQIEEYGLTRGTLAAAGTVEIDLFDGTLKNFFDQSVVFNTLKFAAIFVTTSSYDIPGTTGKLRIGNAATNGNALWFGAVGNTQTIFPGGLPFIQGDPTGVVVDTSNRKVKLENTHGSQAVYYVALFAGLV